MARTFRFIAALLVLLSLGKTAGGTTKGLSQIVTPDLQSPGDLSLSLQIQDQYIGNPYEVQAELGLTNWAEVAVFQGFKPDEEIIATELGILTKKPFLLSTGFINWSPRNHSDPQPFLEGGYYTEHHKLIAGAISVNNKIEAILGYAYDFNKQWRAQLDFQSGSGNSVTAGFTWSITDDLQFNPAVYLTNDSPHRFLGYAVITYTFHLWNPTRGNNPEKTGSSGGAERPQQSE